MMSFIILVEWLIVLSEHRTQSKLEFLQFVHRLFIDRQSITKLKRPHRRYPGNGHAYRIAQSGTARQITGPIDRSRIDKSAQAHGFFIARPREWHQKLGYAKHATRA